MPNEVRSTHGKKTIEVRLRFFTDDLAQQDGHIVPKHCWSIGGASMPVNEDHGIESRQTVLFNSIAAILPAIEELFSANGIQDPPWTDREEVLRRPRVNRRNGAPMRRLRDMGTPHR